MNISDHRDCISPVGAPKKQKVYISKTDESVQMKLGLHNLETSLSLCLILRLIDYYKKSTFPYMSRSRLKKKPESLTDREGRQTRVE